MILDSLPDHWGTVAAELLRVKQMEEWKKYADSFSAYLEILATQSKKSRSTFWRLLLAGKAYNALLAEFDPKMRRFPRLEEVRHSPSPESLELLGKISRAAPDSVVKDLKEKTLKAEVGRDDLLSIWRSYRPLLAGKTKRGRGAVAPSLDRADQDLQIPLYEANALAQFKEAGPEWAEKVHNPFLYRVISHLGRANQADSEVLSFDILVLYAATQTSPLMIHGIEVGSFLAQGKSDRLLTIAKTTLDFLWFASFEEDLERQLDFIPKQIGIFALGPPFRVIRHAVRIRRESGSTEVFLKSVLRMVAKSRT